MIIQSNNLEIIVYGVGIKDEYEDLWGLLEKNLHHKYYRYLILFQLLMLGEKGKQTQKGTFSKRL